MSVKLKKEKLKIKGSGIDILEQVINQVIVGVEGDNVLVIVQSIGYILIIDNHFSIHARASNRRREDGRDRVRLDNEQSIPFHSIVIDKTHDSSIEVD